MGKIGNVINGNSINAKIKQEKYSNIEKGYSYIATKDIDLETSKIDYNNGIRIPFEEKEIFKIAPKNSILICSEGGSAGKKVGFIEKEVAFVNKLFNFNGYINNINRYIYYLWKSPFFNEKFENVKTGIIGGVSINNFKNILIPLPPLAEQKRIIEKVDMIMDMLDKLEKELIINI
ncbi:type I restriction enzyme, S subunit [Clostridium cochlearium]|uniref:Type I restriction enzyme, S subunit n=1 Tax=Clostridium cochlearium TaxID=1494 RepID=A0ABY0QJ97_CLOCO|nr:type I restriction enzyme, S subunit [Clostridium cochlearium]